MTTSSEAVPKKVIVLTNKADSAGGLPRYAMDIAHLLHDKGQLVAVLAKSSRVRWRVLSPDITLISFRLNWLPLKFDCLLFSLISWWYKKKESDSLLFACTEIINPDIAICGFTHKGYLRAINKTPTLKERIEIFYETLSYRNSRLILARSAKMNDELVTLYGVHREKILLTYPPMDRDVFYLTDHLTEKNELSKRLKIDFNGRVVFLFPSVSGHKRKGIDALLRAFAKFENESILLIVGNQDGVGSSNVIELGAVENMSELYAACDYTILASIYEPFGLIGVESVLCGTPVVLSNQCGCNEVLSEAVRLNFDANDQMELNAAITQAIQKPFRVDNPLQHILYDPSFETHIQAVINRMA